MSYLELDDKILDHPKFVLAADRGGSAAIHMWLGLRAYCGQQLTDGIIPKFMLRKVAGPERVRDREHALAVLIDVGLVQDYVDHYQLHDYLQHCRSRAVILESRRRNAERQAKSRGSNAVTDTATTRAVTPSVTMPSPLLSSPLQEEKEKITPHPSGGAPSEGADISADDLGSFQADPVVIREKKPKRPQKTRAVSWRRFPPDFVPDDSHRQIARELLLNLDEQLAAIRDYEFPKPHSDAAATLRTWLRNASRFGRDMRVNQKSQPKQPNGGAWQPRVERPTQ